MSAPTPSFGVSPGVGTGSIYTVTDLSDMHGIGFSSRLFVLIDGAGLVKDSTVDSPGLLTASATGSYRIVLYVTNVDGEVGSIGSGTFTVTAASSFLLEDLPALQRAFWRASNTDSADEGLNEQDVDAQDAVTQFLQYGLWSAQDYIIRFVDAGRWLTSFTIPGWSGSETTDGGTYFTLPSDFLLLAGSDDAGFSAVREPNGTMWGSLIRWQDRFLRQQAPCYFMLNSRMYKVIGARVPTSLVLDYHYRHAIFLSGADATDIDFPVHWRPLIVAFALMHAKAEAWLPGGSQQAREIEANLAHWKGEVARGRDKSHTPPRMQHVSGMGPNGIIPQKRGRWG